MKNKVRRLILVKYEERQMIYLPDRVASKVDAVSSIRTEKTRFSPLSRSY